MGASDDVFVAAFFFRRTTDFVLLVRKSGLSAGESVWKSGAELAGSERANCKLVFTGGTDGVGVMYKLSRVASCCTSRGFGEENVGVGTEGCEGRIA